MSIQIKTIPSVPASEFSSKFWQGCYDRMAVSHAKYGLVADAYPEKVDAIASLRRRLERYEETGNTEWLMDVANFAMIEFMHPRHEEAHFRATDSKESPGRVWETGVHAGANQSATDSVRAAAARYTRGGD
jgi:rhamnogalacturonyl hydrolase YesR